MHGPCLDYLRTQPLDDDEQQRRANGRALVHVALSSACMLLLGAVLSLLVVVLGLEQWVAMPMFAVSLGMVGILVSLVGAVLYVKRHGLL